MIETEKNAENAKSVELADLLTAIAANPDQDLLSAMNLLRHTPPVAVDATQLLRLLQQLLGLSSGQSSAQSSALAFGHACIDYYQAAIATHPNLAQLHYALGTIYAELQQHDAARACYTTALQLQPTYAEAYFSLGNLDLKAGKLTAASALYQQAIAFKPEFAKPYINQAYILEKQGELEAAIALLQTAIVIQPDIIEAHTNLGNILSRLDRKDEAFIHLQRALELKPDLANVYWSLCAILLGRNSQLKFQGFRYWRQITDRYREFCADDGIRALLMSIHAYLNSGLNEAAATNFLELEALIYRRAKSLSRTEIEAIYGNLPFPMPNLRDEPAANSQLSKLICDIYFNPKSHPLSISTSAIADNFESGASKQRDLRIGLMSPHFRRHSVGWCSVDVIRELSRLTPHLFLYATTEIVADALTKKFEQVATRFYELPKPKNDRIVNRNLDLEVEVIEAIAEDDLDILIDLDGLTVVLHGKILSQQPAAVCLSWLGFDAPYVSSQNYFLSDWYTHPEGIEPYYLEQLVRMPNSHMAISGFVVEDINRDAVRAAYGIEPDWTVYLSPASGRKFNRDSARAYVNILKHVPRSVLLCKGLGDAEVIQTTYGQECEALGVDFNRLIFLPRYPSEEEHRSVYTLADIALDTYPYNGGTHNLEALWFNLPTVTRVGQQSFARMGYSFLSSLGIESGIAWNWEEFIEWGIRFGQDRDRRQAVKQQLIQSKQPDSLSPLWNPRLFARDMYSILQSLRWTENNPEKSPEKSPEKNSEKNSEKNLEQQKEGQNG